MRMNFLDMLAYLIVVIGGINWGLVGFFDYNLVAEVFGADAAITNILYGIVGVSAVYLLFIFMKVSRAEPKDS